MERMMNRREVLKAAAGAGLAAVASTELFRNTEAQEIVYPEIVTPDPTRSPEFPNVPFGDRPALAEYAESFENGDYFEDGHGDVDLPQYHFRVMTAGKVKIDQLGIDLESDSEETGVAVILINHYGKTAMFRDAEVDNGFTVAGRVWDMSEPEMVTEAGQALLDHYMGRMTESEDGANCGVIEGCNNVKWAVAVVGNGELQQKWEGTYSAGQETE